MDELLLRRKHCNQRGFTLLETLIAITILSVGLLGMAALMAKTTASASTSRYLSTQSLLASEKLDDLTGRSSLDPDIAVPNGTSSGSLTADGSQSVTVSGVTSNVDYYDQMDISNGNGAITELLTTVDSAGQVVYETIVHNPDGTVTETNSTTPPAAPTGTSDTLGFHRRWVIENDTPIVGVKRITVSVTVLTQPPVPAFQMSTIRPCMNGPCQ